MGVCLLNELCDFGKYFSNVAKIPLRRMVKHVERVNAKNVDSFLKNKFPEFIQYVFKCQIFKVNSNPMKMLFNEILCVFKVVIVAMFLIQFVCNSFDVSLVWK